MKFKVGDVIRDNDQYEPLGGIILEVRNEKYLLTWLDDNTKAWFSTDFIDHEFVLDLNSEFKRDIKNILDD